jgi:Tfp pilus assembly protein PilF
MLTTSLLGQEMVTRVEIELVNQSDQPMTPRFSVQREQPYPWLIESGPEVLRPGEDGRYVIQAGYPAVYFPASEGAQIVVSDASGNYAMREVVDIPPEPSLADPDAVLNPTYALWSELGPGPVGWNLSSEPEGTGVVRMEMVDGRHALVLRATEPGTLSALRLSQEITFPDPFYIWVYPTSNIPSHAQDTGCGLEFYDGVYTTRVIFGGTQYQVKRDGQVVSVTLPAPATTWSQQRVALNEYYQMLDLPLPPVTRRVRNSLSYQTRQVQMGLSFVPDESEDGRAVCGAIQQTPDRVADSNDRLEQALQDPTAYYVGLGNDYRSQRNYGLAKEAYAAALEYDAENPEAYLGLGEAHFWLAEYIQARAAFLDALARGSQREGDARKGVAWSQYSLGDYEAAVEQFEAAANAYLLRNSPNDTLSLADAYNGLGWAWLQLGACDRAVPYFDRALEVVPSLAGALDGRVRCTIP